MAVEEKVAQVAWKTDEAETSRIVNGFMQKSHYVAHDRIKVDLKEEEQQQVKLRRMYITGGFFLTLLVLNFGKTPF